MSGSWPSMARLEESRALLESLRRDSGAMRFVSQRSYYHSNGFVKLGLDVLHARRGIHRIHYWKQGDRHCETSSFHDHSWAFSSTILDGALHVKTASVSNSGDPSLQVMRWCVGGLSAPDVAPKGSVSLSVQEDRWLAAGDSYSQVPSTIHKVSSPGALTLVVQGEPVRNHSFVFGDEPVSPYERERLSVSSCREIIDMTIECLLNTRRE